jgi:hypothetical protein
MESATPSARELRGLLLLRMHAELELFRYRAHGCWADASLRKIVVDEALRTSHEMIRKSRSATRPLKQTP